MSMMSSKYPKPLLQIAKLSLDDDPTVNGRYPFLSFIKTLSSILHRRAYSVSSKMPRTSHQACIFIFFSLLAALKQNRVSSFTTLATLRQCTSSCTQRQPRIQLTTTEKDQEEEVPSSILRRALLVGSSLFVGSTQASAASLFSRNQKSSLYTVDTRDGISDSVLREQVDTPVPTLSSEYALLKVLPVKNPVFRALQSNIEALSSLRLSDGGDEDPKEWTKAHNSIQTSLVMLDKKRPQLEPVFNPEDSTELAILKGERGEILIETLREELIGLANATTFQNSMCTFDRQKGALLALGRLGELLVKAFPYDVPSKGKFSYLPRLLGRAMVTVKIKRAGASLGNITIVADGFTAPITAGNFVDLCMRNFYTGLPVKSITKRFGSVFEQNSAQVSVLGSYNDGFFDPITAKLRTLPLEIIRLEGGSGLPKLSYSSAGLSDTSLSDMLGNYQPVESSQNSKPMLTFDTPGLVAMYHPDRAPNSGSSAFFSLQSDTLPQDRRKVLDGEYAPFGFIIDGYDTYEALQPGDVIESTLVDEFGALNLVKIRESSLKEAASATES